MGNRIRKINGLNGMNRFKQVCIRREYGHCRIGWRQAADRDSFKLSRGAASYNGAAGPGSSNCDPDAAIIIGNNQT